MAAGKNKRGFTSLKIAKSLTGPVRKNFSNQAGFTLLELIVTVIIIAILASIALPRYIRVVEKGRSAEARDILGQIRSAEIAYSLENNDQYTTSLTLLQISIPSGTCNSDYYFRYSLAGGGASFTATADRCTSGGKPPNAGSGYQLNITQNGVLGGTAGYV